MTNVTDTFCTLTKLCEYWPISRMLELFMHRTAFVTTAQTRDFDRRTRAFSSFIFVSGRQ